MRLRQKPQNLLSSKLEADFIVFWLVLQVVLNSGAFGIRGGTGFEEIGLDHVGIGILGNPFHGLGFFLIPFVKGSEAERAVTEISKIADIVLDHPPV